MALKPSRQGCLRLYLYMALVSAVVGAVLIGTELVQTSFDPRSAAWWMGLLQLLLCIALLACAIATLLAKRWGVLGLFITALVFLISAVVEISFLPSGSFEKVASGIFFLLLMMILALPELKQPQANS
jgi:uncharacterized membrane protein YhaH (DUF805 family)